eukprot:441060-Amphidinium_carterae.1
MQQYSWQQLPMQASAWIKNRIRGNALLRWFDPFSQPVVRASGTKPLANVQDGKHVLEDHSLGLASNTHFGGKSEKASCVHPDKIFPDT